MITLKALRHLLVLQGCVRYERQSYFLSGYFDSKGNLMTELSKLPLEGLSLFNDADRPYVKKILNEAGLKLEGLHEYLQKELQAL